MHGVDATMSDDENSSLREYSKGGGVSKVGGSVKMDRSPIKIALMIRSVSPRWYRYNEGETFELRVGGECFFDYRGPSQRQVFCRGISLVESAQELFNLIEMGRKGYSGV
jgi:hypothetical protein